ncbi:MAG: bifunctional preprotein translocase subunit SecD/SecF [Lentisphaerae bacterium ADurb.Bin242]|nr:MAG: bifunctional preprotein translocase subunit SecD/SecF [Lentisphaerae bacterium ADurb.Bin242]
MNKKPIILRSAFALLVLGVFVFSMYPLQERNFYDTFKEICADPDNQEVVELIALAREKKQKDPSMYDSVALESAALDKGVSLDKYVKPILIKSQKISNSRDVLSLIRKNSAGSIRRGIDLNGGAEFLLELIPDPADKDKINKDFNKYRDLAIETLRKRLTQKNIFEADISPAGGRYISMRVPIVTREEKGVIEKLIKMSAKLQFKLVHPNNQAEAAKYMEDPKGYQPPEGYEVKVSSETRNGKTSRMVYIVERAAQMDGKEINDAYPTMDQYGQREIILSFKPAGAARFGEITSNNVGRELAIILDGTLYSAPRINQAITGGNAQITGNFSREDAENISNALVSGSVPFSMTIQAQSDIDPTIGAETVRDGLYSGIAGMILVMVFMLVYYLRSGVIANISLFINAVLILGALAAFDVTLTLPGIAGIILTIGMAVDANVLIYERIREEVQSGKTILNSIDLGFDRAYSAIFDSNITTLFVAVILLWQGTGAIKGFAITLAIGVFTTLFTAVFLTRLLFDLMTRFTSFKKMRMLSLGKTPNVDFLGLKNYALAFSFIMIIATFVVIGVRGKDCLGIDFTGGTQITYDFVKAIPAEQISAFLDTKGFENKVTYKTGSAVDAKKQLEIVIREKSGRNKEQTAEAGTNLMENISRELNSQFPDARFKGESQSTLGALIGETFMKSALVSIVLSFAVMILYMTFRFQFSYSIAGNVVLLHDVIIGVGLYLMCGGQITMNVVAAALTIVGISINDTIVTFDRVRENLRLVRDKSYKDIINLSVNQTLARTILTASTILMVLFMQLIFGGAGIRDFVAVMLFGQVIGTYSSIFITNLIISYWHKPVRSVKEAPAEILVAPSPGAK